MPEESNHVLWLVSRPDRLCLRFHSLEKAKTTALCSGWVAGNSDSSSNLAQRTRPRGAALTAARTDRGSEKVGHYFLYGQPTLASRNIARIRRLLGHRRAVKLMRQLDYFIVDVFTDSALAGNPLAVVMNTVDLSTAQMQSIAREFNLSETTFVERRDASAEQTEGVRVRIFTTQEELPFAGHPTLGTASVLREHAPETVRQDTVTLAENVGPIPVRFGAGFPVRPADSCKSKNSA